MPNKRRIRRDTAKQLATMAARDEAQIDWANVDAVNQDQVERFAGAAEGALSAGWENRVVLGLPPGKDAVKIRIDRDVLAWFHGTGKASKRASAHQQCATRF